MKEHASTLIIRDRLLTGLDNEFNVVDVEVVMGVLCNLERIDFSKEALEITRLGKIVNDLRKRTNNRNLAVRAKELVRKWRQDFLPAEPNHLVSCEEIRVEKSIQIKRLGNEFFAEKSPKRLRYDNQYNENGQYENSPIRLSSNHNQSSDSYIGGSCKLYGFTNGNYSTILPEIPSNKCESSSPIRFEQPSTHIPCSSETPIQLIKSQNCQTKIDKTQNDKSSNNFITHKYGKTSFSYRGNRNKLDSDYYGATSSCSELEGERDILSENVPSRICNGRSPDYLKNNMKYNKLTRKRDRNDLPLNSASCSDFIFSENNIEASLCSLPSSPIKLRSSTRKTDKDDILQKQIRSARRSGYTSKVRTTEEIVKELTRIPMSSPVETDEQELGRKATGNIPCNDKLNIREREYEPENDNAPRTDLMFLNPLAEAKTLSMVSNDPHLMSESKLQAGSVEDILSKLPVINASEILAQMMVDLEKEQDTSIENSEFLYGSTKPKFITEEAVMQLNDHNIECLNGNLSYDGEFKRWHECVSKYSDEDKLLHMLPYTVID